MPGLFTACVKSAEPPIVVTGVIEQHLVLTQALKGPDPERAAIINRMPKPFCIARKRPGQISGCVNRAQPPIVVTGVVKEKIIPAVTVKICLPKGPAISDLPKTACIPGERPLNPSTNEGADPPVHVTGMIEENTLLILNLKVSFPDFAVLTDKVPEVDDLNFNGSRGN